MLTGRSYGMVPYFCSCSVEHHQIGTTKKAAVKWRWWIGEGHDDAALVSKPRAAYLLDGMYHLVLYHLDGSPSVSSKMDGWYLAHMIPFCEESVLWRLNK
jgi:hypothetical protein